MARSPIQFLFLLIHFYLISHHHINSQLILTPSIFNLTSTQISSNTSRYYNVTPVVIIGPILLNNSTITQQQQYSSTRYNNSTKSNPYKTLINFLLVFYTIIFEKYSRR